MLILQGSGRHRKTRAGIAPILAEVVLIAITLSTAAALSSYFFGLFNTMSSPAMLSIQAASVRCAAPGSGASLSLPDGTAVPPGQCGMVVTNSGVVAGYVVGAGPRGVFSGSVLASYAVGGNGHADVFVHHGAAVGSTVTGYLLQANGPELLFTAVVQ